MLIVEDFILVISTRFQREQITVTIVTESVPETTSQHSVDGSCLSGCGRCIGNDS